MRKLLLLFLLIGFHSFGQRYSFIEYSTEEGLPQSQVTSICQDKDGYLWIGTLGGLAKFNGITFTSYTREDGLANNKIISQAYFNNTHWIGHEGGISRNKDGVFKSWNLPVENKNIQVSQIISVDERIIIASNGTGLYELKNDKITPLSFNGKYDIRVRDMLFFENEYYLATRDGLFVTRDFSTFKIVPNTSDWSISDLELYKNKISITTFQDGIYLYKPQTHQFNQIPINPDFFLASSFADDRGRLWISAAEGMLIYDGKATEFINEEKGMPQVIINRIFEDDEQNIWVGSAGKGLICFSGEQFVHHNQSTGLPSDLIIDVNEDNLGQFWISTYNKGLVLQKTNGEFVSIHDEIPTFWCSAMNVNGLNWFGTETGLLAFKNDKLQQTFNFSDGLASLKNTAIHKVSSTKMYIGGSGGLTLYSQGKFSIVHDNDIINIGTIRDIDQSKNIIYLATDKGFYRLKGNKVEAVDQFSKTTFSLQKDNEGTLWLGTEEGLYSYKNGVITNRNFSNETASKFINFLNFNKDKLYIGTNNGLYTYYPNLKGKGEKIEHFGIEEGVVNLETNLNSSYIDDKGRLWFGTASGLVIYDETKDAKKNIAPPRILLKSLLLNYAPIQFSETQKQSLSIHYTKNNISFNFDGISLSNPKELKFQYWLEGVDPDWAPETNNPTVNYTGLRSGNYILHARAKISQNEFSREIQIPFEIRPPYYQTWWFILIMLFILGAMVYGFIRFRLQREREKSEKEKIVIQNKLLSLEQQSLNASMNRHFIFNSLNSIQYFINTQDRTSANKYLTNFAQLIRKNLDSSTSEGNLVSLSKEIERLKLYLSLESMRFKDRFEYTFDINVKEAEYIMIPSMLLQPFIENSIVHGLLPQKDLKGEIEIKAWTEEEVLFVSIKDNGIGISKSLGSKKSSAGDHKSQGMEITAKRISLIKQMSNKGFEIIGPQDFTDDNRSINGTHVLLKIPFENLEN